jgi:hypothetical protein
MGENSGQRAVKVYSAVAAKYSTSKYSAPIGDALSAYQNPIFTFVLDFLHEDHWHRSLAGFLIWRPLPGVVGLQFDDVVEGMPMSYL